MILKFYTNRAFAFGEEKHEYLYSKLPKGLLES